MQAEVDTDMDTCGHIPEPLFIKHIYVFPNSTRAANAWQHNYRTLVGACLENQGRYWTGIFHLSFPLCNSRQPYKFWIVSI